MCHGIANLRSMQPFSPPRKESGRTGRKPGDTASHSGPATSATRTPSSPDYWLARRRRAIRISKTPRIVPAPRRYDLATRSTSISPRYFEVHSQTQLTAILARKPKRAPWKSISPDLKRENTDRKSTRADLKRDPRSWKPRTRPWKWKTSAWKSDPLPGNPETRSWKPRTSVLKPCTRPWKPRACPWKPEFTFHDISRV